MTTHHKKLQCLGTVAVCALALASGAAASPSSTQYDNPIVQEPSVVATVSPAATPPSTTPTTPTTSATPATPTTTLPSVTPPANPLVIPRSTHASPLAAAKGALPSAVGAAKGTLPFTGLNLAVVLIGGFGAAVAGVGLRRVARRRSS